MVVIKVGGSLQEAGLTALLHGVSGLLATGQAPIVVHGGGPRISAALQSAKIELPFVDGQRQTTPEAMAIVERVLAEEVNGELVQALREAGFAAVGIHAPTYQLLHVETSTSSRTGRITHADSGLLMRHIEMKQIPVIAPIGLDVHGWHYNINADLAASAIAGAVSADRIIFCTDVAGIYEDWAARRQLYDVEDVLLAQFLREGRFHAGMIPKVEAVLSALQAGVGAAYIVHGSDTDSIAWAVEDALQAERAFVREQFGTKVTRTN